MKKLFIIEIKININEKILHFLIKHILNYDKNSI